MVVPGTDNILLAAGGQDAEIHLSCYAPSPQSRSRPHWQFNDRIRGSINNSLLLTSLSMSQSHESSAEPRVVVSNNDGTVRFFDVPVRAEYTSPHLCEAGAVQLNVAINHCALHAPDSIVHQLIHLQLPSLPTAALYCQLATPPRSFYIASQVDHMSTYRQYLQCPYHLPIPPHCPTLPTEL